MMPFDDQKKMGLEYIPFLLAKHFKDHHPDLWRQVPKELRRNTYVLMLNIMYLLHTYYILILFY